MTPQDSTPLASTEEMEKILNNWEMLCNIVKKEELTWGEHCALGASRHIEISKALPYIRSLQSRLEKAEAESKKLRGIVIDLQQEHCDSHCANGCHVSLCVEASKALSSLHHQFPSQQ